jgi:hypothetical protein
MNDDALIGTLLLHHNYNIVLVKVASRYLSLSIVRSLELLNRF